ncbi:hypothetical protein MCUN1_001648 [Malassezia cuniculi]|uniref:Monopolin complex subunit Csm1/Pcs1 C-terminal domain-containing protein n=1 Tax=Malassezia cuniculi TaxID=948313 RepID=A0AAF0EUH9_9BASI|nr:hypothetical protein MCUN1_001648 [Malassezia cuniculi]
MPFGIKTGRRGRPPKDRAYESAETPSKLRRVDDGSIPTSDSVAQTAEELEAELRELRAQYEQDVEERVAQALRERDAIQSQFDRLKELRVTQSEKTLLEWKRASETRHRHALESIASWKNRAEHAEKRLREFERDPDSKPRASHHDTEVDRHNPSHKQSKASPDADAVKRIYEDLTGFVVTETEIVDEEQSLRRFRIAFSGAGYNGSYILTDLHFSLEESHAEEESGKVREDLVYIPHIDEQRDAALLASENMPDHFLEQIRFERNVATKFLAALHKSLKKM